MTSGKRFTPLQRSLLLLTAILLLAAALYSGLLQQRLVNPALAPLDERAQAALQQSLVLSSASFATARLIDRGIAFVSEAEVGVGVASVKPGQLLKPLQDMAVRYSDLMVVAMTSVGLQLFLLEFGKLAALSMVLGMTLILQALKHGDAGLVAILSSVSPVLVLPLLWLIYKRSPAFGAWLGAALTVLGTVLILR